MKDPNIIHEPFIATFTGQLSIFQSVSTGNRYSLQKPYPKIYEGVCYMIQINRKSHGIRMIHVLIPRWRKEWV